jgi:hypothetical protein
MGCLGLSGDEVGEVRGHATMRSGPHGWGSVATQIQAVYSCSRDEGLEGGGERDGHRGQLPMICSRKPKHRRSKPRIAKRDCL